MAAAAAVVASQASKENPSVRIPIRSKTLKSIWGATDQREPKNINPADLHPKNPFREVRILLDETMEMRLNGVSCILWLVEVGSLLIFLLFSRAGKAGELCALTQRFTSP